MAAEQPEELPDVDSLTEAVQEFRQMMPADQGGWRPACANCLNYHKLGIMAVSAKLMKAGIQPGSPKFGQAMHQAVQMGQVLMHNPIALQGLNGAKPDVIPAVRPADTMVNGNAVCAVCFQPQEQQPGQGLVVAQASFNPSQLRRPGQLWQERRLPRSLRYRRSRQAPGILICSGSLRRSATG